MILVVGLPDLRSLAQCGLPARAWSRYRPCAPTSTPHATPAIWSRSHSRSGEKGPTSRPIAGPPDVTFFNPVTGNVHVAIGDPGVVETINPVTGARKLTVTGADAHTTAWVPPDRLYVTCARRRSRACGRLSLQTGRTPMIRASCSFRTINAGVALVLDASPHRHLPREKSA